ncbi:hypothetical protein N9L31_00270 [bacterium]|nr:hypothetical protein [bacterium]
MSSECGQRFAAIVVVLGLLAGLAMTATGVSLTLSAPDAGEDFSALESKCVITNVFHEMTTESRHNHATKGSRIIL